MAMKVLTLEGLNDFLMKCKALFASQTEVDINDVDIDTYVLNIKNENYLTFDTSEIV